jgi:hypothetical protein
MYTVYSFYAKYFIWKHLSVYEKKLFMLGTLYFPHQQYTNLNKLDTLVPEALCEAKETRGEKEEPLVTSVANPTSTLDLVQNLILACDWPFVKICQTSLGNKHYCKLIVAIMVIISLQ